MRRREALDVSCSDCYFLADEAGTKWDLALSMPVSALLRPARFSFFEFFHSFPYLHLPYPFLKRCTGMGESPLSPHLGILSAPHQGFLVADFPVPVYFASAEVDCFSAASSGPAFLPSLRHHCWCWGVAPTLSLLVELWRLLSLSHLLMCPWK